MTHIQKIEREKAVADRKARLLAAVVTLVDELARLEAEKKTDICADVLNGRPCTCHCQ